jgi:hypothetical protein
MKPPNPFVQLLSLIAGVAIFAVSVLIGGILLAGLVGFVLLTMIVIYARVWWLQRKFSAAAKAREGEDYVEAEYRVIDVTRKDDTER